MAKDVTEEEIATEADSEDYKTASEIITGGVTDA